MHLSTASEPDLPAALTRAPAGSWLLSGHWTVQGLGDLPRRLQAQPCEAGPLVLDGSALKAIDSAAPHAFTFTPAISLWIECSSRQEIERVSTLLAEGGTMLMPPDNYGFSQWFCWVADRYGVTWQLNLAQ